MPRLFLLCLAFLLVLPAGARAAVVHETIRVPTVDGAEVSVDIVRDDAHGKVPVILTYSPYNVLGEPSPVDDSIASEYVPLGYARAVADVLGTRNSSGCWDYGGPKESQSGVDLVRALARQPWSNGKVGMIGGSYDGTTATMVASRGDELPELRAIVPQAAINHWYGYAYQDGVRYLGNTQEPSDEGFDTPLAFDFGLGRTPPRDPAAMQALVDRLDPCDAAEHTQHGYDTSPDYDDFWKERDYRKDAARFRAAVLVTHGWQDYNVKQSEGVDLFTALPVDDKRTTTRVEGVPFKRLYMFQGPHGAPGASEYDELVKRAARVSPAPARGRPGHRRTGHRSPVPAHRRLRAAPRLPSRRPRRADRGREVAARPPWPPARSRRTRVGPSAG